MYLCRKHIFYNVDPYLLQHWKHLKSLISISISRFLHFAAEISALSPEITLIRITSWWVLFSCLHACQMFLGLIQLQIKAPDCLNNLCDLFCLQICLRRRLRPQRWSWASLRCSTPKSWSPRRPRTLWRSSPTFPGTTASSAGCLVVCSPPSDAFVYIHLRQNSVVVWLKGCFSVGDDYRGAPTGSGITFVALYKTFLFIHSGFCSHASFIPTPDCSLFALFSFLTLQQVSPV